MVMVMVNVDLYSASSQKSLMTIVTPPLVLSLLIRDYRHVQTFCYLFSFIRFPAISLVTHKFSKPSFYHNIGTQVVLYF